MLITRKLLLCFICAVLPCDLLAEDFAAKEICDLSDKGSVFDKFLPLCVDSSDKSSSAVRVFENIIYDLDSHFSEKRQRAFLAKLRPKLTSADYYYLLSSVEFGAGNPGAAKKYLYKSSELGNASAAYQIYTSHGNQFEYLSKAFKGGHSGAKFLYAVEISNGTNGLNKDIKKASQLIFEAALDGDYSAVPAVVQYKEWLSLDQNEFWASMQFIIEDRGKDIAVVEPNVSNWSGYCQFFFKAQGACALVPDVLHQKTKDHLVSIIENCGYRNNTGHP